MLYNAELMNILDDCHETLCGFFLLARNKSSVVTVSDTELPSLIAVSM